MVGDSFGRAAWGWALAALMVGFIVGGLVSLRWRPRHGLYAGTALLSLTAAAVGFDRWLVVVGIVMGGSSLLALLSPSVRHLERRRDVAADEVGAS